MKTFYKLLGIALLAITMNNFAWFALTYWAYLSTNSVIATSTMGGIFLVLMAISSIWFGSIVDHNKKKYVMIASSLATLLLFTLGLAFFYATPESDFSTIASVRFWIFIAMLLTGAMVGMLYNIAIPTLVGLVVPEPERAQANGLFGMVMGVSFAITSIGSGIALGYGGMPLVLTIAIGGIVIAIIALALLPLPEPKLHATKDQPKKVDIKGTIKAIKAVPGLFALIFFTTFNNLLGGVFMALMDAYGLSLVPVAVWGTLWGVLSLGFIIGGLYIAEKGVGEKPLKTLFRNNVITWTVCIFFTVQPSIVLLAVGSFIWMTLFPFIEAIEQTIFQKVVPPERLGRVFGFAHSVEQGASPLTAFIIGPIAQLVFIPFMTTGGGVALIGDWFGTGTGRGIALVFIFTGIIGLMATVLAWQSRSYKVLSTEYARSKE